MFRKSKNKLVGKKSGKKNMKEVKEQQLECEGEEKKRKYKGGKLVGQKSVRGEKK